MKLQLLRGHLLPVYGTGVLGAFLQIAGAQWDVSSHELGIVETFFTPAHAVLYSGILLVAIASLLGLLSKKRLSYYETIPRSVFVGFRLAAIGSGTQFVAAPIDFWWHSHFGFDPYLFTPGHSLLIIGLLLGGIGMAVGSVRLLQARRAGFSFARSFISSSWFQVLAIVALATLWLDLNFFGYFINDVVGMSYTFRFCTPLQIEANFSCPFIQQYQNWAFLSEAAVFALAGTLVFFSARTIFARKGMATLVALVVSLVYATAAIGFTAFALEFLKPPGSFYLPNVNPAVGAKVASFLPIYFILIVPIILLDLLTKNADGKRTVLTLSPLVGFFASLVDGRYSSSLWFSGLQELEYFIVPMIIGGLVGGILSTRFTNGLLSQNIPSLAVGEIAPRRL